MHQIQAFLDEQLSKLRDYPEDYPCTLQLVFSSIEAFRRRTGSSDSTAQMNGVPIEFDGSLCENQIQIRVLNAEMQVIDTKDLLAMAMSDIFYSDDFS